VRDEDDEDVGCRRQKNLREWDTRRIEIFILYRHFFSHKKATSSFVRIKTPHTRSLNFDCDIVGGKH